MEDSYGLSAYGSNMKKPPIPFHVWEKFDIRTGEIIEVEDIKGADKLYKLKIDLGTETRTIVAGLKSHYTREDLDGKKCIVLVNLEPREIKGIVSHGMLLAAVNDDKSEVKLLLGDGVIEPGWKIS